MGHFHLSSLVIRTQYLLEYNGLEKLIKFFYETTTEVFI